MEPHTSRAERLVDVGDCPPFGAGSEGDPPWYLFGEQVAGQRKPVGLDRSCRSSSTAGTAARGPTPPSPGRVRQQSP